jgi:hypothetical protein
MVLAMVVAASAQAISISLVPGALTITPSTIFVIDVVITGAESPGVEVVDVVVSYNPALVTGVNAAEGSFISAQGGPLMEFEEVNNNDGFVSYTVTRLGMVGSIGSGTAVSLTFHCEGPGLAELVYAAAATDVEGTIIAEAYDTIEVQQGGGAVPEPMTLALVGVALTALGVVARKRS